MPSKNLPAIAGRTPPAGLLARMATRLLGSAPVIEAPLRRSRPGATFMRDNSGGFLNSWRPFVRDAQDDVRAAWQMGASRAVDSLHNSGWLAGAVDQASADTIGPGLRLNATPDAEGLGWTPKYTRKWCRTVERRWKAWASNPMECDARGRRTIADMTDAAIRYHFAFGEAIALLPRIRRPESRSELKVMMVSPHRLMTNTVESLRTFQGITLDPNGLPVSYYFRRKVDGVEHFLNIKARAGGRTQVVHVFDGQPDQVRGMTPLAPVLLRFRQYEQLGDATLTAALLQTIIAATVKSSGLSDDVFEGFQASAETGKESQNEIPTDIQGFLDAKLEWWKNRTIDLGTHGRIAHLFPGEEFEIHGPKAVTNNYLPYSKGLLREIARCVGTTYESMTGDYEGATYSSVRMGNASIFGITMRRRNRIAIPFVQPIYEAFLEEEIASGRIEFKGGLEAFRAKRIEACAAEWAGPAKATADDLKSAKAASERLRNGTTTLAFEMAEYGLDPETVAEQRHQERALFMSFGLPDPYAPPPMGGDGVAKADGADDDGEAEDPPKREKA